MQKNTIASVTSCSECNVIFISIDTLRAQNMSLYGYHRQTTPNITQFAEKSVVFTNAISVAPWTLPATMSWFTGAYPSQHKVVNKYVLDGTSEKIANLKDLSPTYKTLAQILKERGYKTAAFTGGAGVGHEFGFNLGFDTYVDDQNFGGFSYTIPKAQDWINLHKQDKFFIFLHGYDVHGQYVPDDGYDRRFVDFNYEGKLTGSKEEQKSMREEGVDSSQLFLTKPDVNFLLALYDEKIQKADQKIGAFIKYYQSTGLLAKTLLIITSDHGDEFYEHGRIDHGHSLYEELIHVPLVIYIPGNTHKINIADQVRSIDLFPTILDILQVQSKNDFPDQIAGTSLVPFLKNQHLKLDVFPETDYRYASALRGIRTPDRQKLIKDLNSNLFEMYDLKQDGFEKNNLFINESQDSKLLKQKLYEHFYLD